MPKFAITLKNCKKLSKGLTLSHHDVFDVFINPFTFQEREIKGRNGIRIKWLKIHLSNQTDIKHS